MQKSELMNLHVSMRYLQNRKRQNSYKITWRRGKVKPHWQRFLTPQPNPFHSCIWIPPHFIGLLQKIRVIVYNYNIVKFTNESSSFENKSLINTFESILKVEISILFFLYIFFQHDSTLKLLKLFKWIFQCYLFL